MFGGSYGVLYASRQGPYDLESGSWDLLTGSARVTTPESPIALN